MYIIKLKPELQYVLQYKKLMNTKNFQELDFVFAH